jgi:hypothetical protein
LKFGYGFFYEKRWVKPDSNVVCHILLNNLFCYNFNNNIIIEII